MRIRKITATFGALDNETLELSPGLNIISRPNEAGKSTWAEFWLALLYGVDTRAQVRQGAPLPVKERCRPWNGKPMQGAAELEWNGAPLTIERSSTARTPMGAFQAYGSADAARLNANNCGLLLLGVERSVYERSGFIRQGGLLVNKDEALSQRLGALVSTGEEESSYSRTEARLRELQNHCSRTGTGFLGKTREALTLTERKLHEISSLQERLASLEQQQLTCKQEQQRLTELAAMLEAQDIRRKREQLVRAQETLAQKALLRQRLADGCRALPDPHALTALQRELSTLQNDRQTAAMDAALTLTPPTPPAIPPAFETLRVEQAVETSERIRLLQTPPRKASVLPLCAAVLLFLVGLGAGIALLQQGAVSAFGFAAALAGLVWGLLRLFASKRQRQAAAQRQHEAELLLAKYAVTDADALPVLAQRYAAQRDAYAQAQTEYEAARDRQQQLDASLSQRAQELFARVCLFAPDCNSFPHANDAVTKALQAHTALAAAAREEQQAQETLRALQAAIGTLKELPVPAQLPDISPQELQKQQQQCAQTLHYVRSELDQCRGRLGAVGDPLALNAEIESHTARLAELQIKDAGLTLARQALAQANEQLQARFSPLLCRLAGEIFSRLTGGRYEALLLDGELTVRVRETGAPVLRSSYALSGGAVDQLYLAIRLAICELLLPKDAPLLLDDALMAFDDERAALALAELQRQAAQRQILLFTCHGREQRLLQV